MKKAYVISNLNSGFDLLVGFNNGVIVLGGFMDKKLKDNFITISNIITLSTLMDNIHTSILENKITTLSVNDNGKTPSNRDMVETRKSYHKQKGLNTLKLNLLMNGSSKGFEYEWDLLEFTFSIESARCLYKALSEYHQYLKGV